MIWKDSLKENNPLSEHLHPYLRQPVLFCTRANFLEYLNYFYYWPHSAYHIYLVVENRKKAP